MLKTWTGVKLLYLALTAAAYEPRSRLDLPVERSPF